MIDWSGLAISQQVLLADIGDIAGLAIFSEQVVEWLFAVRADFLRDRFIPLFAVREDRIDIIDHAPKIEDPVAHDIANPEPRLGALGGIDILAGLR